MKVMGFERERTEKMRGKKKKKIMNNKKKRRKNNKIKVKNNI
jgi:hypothetical protein